MTKEKKKPPIKGISQVPDDKLTVIKSNPLSSLWRSELTLSEFKVLDVYLARINSHCPERRQVEITKKEFENVFGISKFNIKELDLRLEHLVGQAVRISDSDYKKGFTWISLFEEARVDFDDDGVQKVYLECTQKAMKYFFSCDNLGYLRYKLRSINDMKSRYTYILFLYLEKHRNMGLEWVESLENLKLFLNCEKDEMYKEFKYFNQRILQRCQKEILEKTECCFSYEPIKKGRKVIDIRFKLESLQSVSTEVDPNQLTFDELPTAADEETQDIEEQMIEKYGTEMLEQLAEACKYEFTREQMEEIFSILNRINVPPDKNTGDIHWGRVFYLREKYAALNVEDSRKKASGTCIKNRYAYFKKMLEKDTSTPAAYGKD